MSEIECEFEQFGLYEPAFTIDGERKKSGRYEGGNMNVEGFGTLAWTVAASIVTKEPLGELLARGIPEEDIVAGCVAFLNRPLTKRARKAPYGTLSCRPLSYDTEKIFIVSVLMWEAPR
jgi:hypothetical protein